MTRLPLSQNSQKKEWRILNMKKNCLVCDKEIIRKSEWSYEKYFNMKYCGRDCYFLTIRGKKGKPSPHKGKHWTAFEKNCSICNKKFLTIPSRIEKRQGKYCSRNCFYNSRKGENTVPWMNIPNRKTWNKGLHIQSNTGRTHFKKGQIGWFRGKKRPEISVIFKGIKPEKAIEAAKITNLGNSYRKGKTFSEESKKKISESKKGQMIGKDNPRWKNGISELRSLVRHLPEYREWRMKIFIRDNFQCIVCGKKGYIEADHYPIMFAILLQEAINLYGKDIQKIRTYIPLFKAQGRTVCKEHHPRIYTGNQYRRGIYL